MDADLFICMTKSYKIHHIPMDIAYSVYHEACKTRGARAESISALALVQAKHGGITQAKNTLDILSQLYNELQTKLDGLSDHEDLLLKYNLLEAEFEATKKLVEKKRQLLLNKDIEESA